MEQKQTKATKNANKKYEQKSLAISVSLTMVYNI